MDFDQIREHIRNWLAAEFSDPNFLQQNFVFQKAMGITSGHFKGTVVVGTLNRPMTFTAYPLVELRYSINGNNVNLIIPFDYITSEEDFISLGKVGGELEGIYQLAKHIKSKLGDRYHQSDDAIFISDMLRKGEDRKHYKVLEVKQIYQNLIARINKLRFDLV